MGFRWQAEGNGVAYEISSLIKLRGTYAGSGDFFFPKRSGADRGPRTWP